MAKRTVEASGVDEHMNIDWVGSVHRRRDEPPYFPSSGQDLRGK